MTQEEFDKAPLLGQILYDETGMLVENHSDIAKAMEKYHQAKLKLLGISGISGWIEFESNKKLFNEEAKKNCWCKFEDGTVIRYKQEHPMERMTHFKLAKTVVK